MEGWNALVYRSNLEEGVVRHSSLHMSDGDKSSGRDTRKQSYLLGMLLHAERP